mmetsp:Transcript_8666/g.23309  ORF Transcript_8666/g.23309 Transcript_8666/m.23309 type:complete len:223 (+) Transcript_8666:3081-3749(+)
MGVAERGEKEVEVVACVPIEVGAAEVGVAICFPPSSLLRLCIIAALLSSFESLSVWPGEGRRDAVLVGGIPLSLSVLPTSSPAEVGEGDEGRSIVDEIVLASSRSRTFDASSSPPLLSVEIAATYACLPCSSSPSPFFFAPSCCVWPPSVTLFAFLSSSPSLSPTFSSTSSSLSSALRGRWYSFTLPDGDEQEEVRVAAGRFGVDLPACRRWRNVSNRDRPF